MDARDGQDFFVSGLELFNAGGFFECHEAWEAVWKVSVSAEKLFLQGLIQVAAALVHVQRGNLRGAIALYRKARDKLASPPQKYSTLMIKEFRGALDDYFGAVEKGTSSEQPIPTLTRRRPGFEQI
jgi:predicted metal-dependent hydrolase